MENATSEEKRVKQCPNCKTYVQYDYSVCPSCGHYFEIPKSERKFISTPTPSPQFGRPRNINVILLLYFFFAAYMIINGLTSIFLLSIPGAIIAGLIIIFAGIIDLVLSVLTRRRLRIAYLAGLVVGIIEIGFFSLALVAVILVPTNATIIVTSLGLVGMKVLIVFLLFREKNYFTEGFRKQELPVKEGIPELPTTPSSYQSESTEPVVPEYQAESLDQEIKTHLNSARSSWEIAESSYKNAVWVEFVLRADDAINSLIKGRYMQLFGPIKPGMSIMPMVEAIRLRGYQLPEREEFERWINFRENIAKGIEKPDKEQIVDAYPFYQEIFDKLGFK